MRGKYRVVVPLVVCALAGGAVVLGALHGRVALAAVEIGQAVPAFELPDVNGKTRKLADFAGKIVVLEFCSIECPFSRGADPHLSALAQRYAPQGVVVIGIDSHKSTTPEQIRKYAQEKGKTYPILKDAGNTYADLLGAKVTPEVFVLDKDGKLAYHGAFDDRKAPEEKGETPYVENAVKALLEGKPVDPATVKAWGCGIKRVEKP